MDSEEIGKKVKDFISKGAEASKSALEKAGDAVQNFSDRSVVKIERQKLVSKRAKLYEQLGEKLSAALLTKGIDLKNLEQAAEAAKDIKELQKEIVALSKEIEEKDKLLQSES